MKSIVQSVARYVFAKCGSKGGTVVLVLVLSIGAIGLFLGLIHLLSMIHPYHNPAPHEVRTPDLVCTTSPSMVTQLRMRQQYRTCWTHGRVQCLAGPPRSQVIPPALRPYIRRRLGSDPATILREHPNIVEAQYDPTRSFPCHRSRGH